MNVKHYVHAMNTEKWVYALEKSRD